MNAVGDVFRWATTKVDETVVSPVANRLVNSVANPYVLSYFIWDRIKRMTPQRARDITRLLSTSISNAVGVLGAEQAHELRSTTKQLQDELVAATVSSSGREVILNSVATVSKVAQALNTPETKVATRQAFETLQSFVDFFASPEGRKVITTAGECLTKVCEVAASPESSILLAEMATNICHAVEVEAMRAEEERSMQLERTAEEIVAASSDSRERQQSTTDNSEAKPSSPTSSTAETSFETDSHVSLATPSAVQAAAKRAEEKTAYRSARIEKDVLLRMGVDPSMISEIQRVLDTIREEEVAAAERADASAEAAAMATEDSDAFIGYTDGEDEEEDAGGAQPGDLGITRAFGFQTSELPAAMLDPTPEVTPAPQPEEEAPAGPEVILPDWHADDTRNALRRRHVQATATMQARDTMASQSRKIATLLHRQRAVAPGASGALATLDPLDLAACKAITKIMVYGLTLFMALISVVVAHQLLTY